MSEPINGTAISFGVGSVILEEEIKIEPLYAWGEKPTVGQIVNFKEFNDTRWNGKWEITAIEKGSYKLRRPTKPQSNESTK